ncbi:hypothetical protein [Carnobacterium maltaromaticum]|uniref:hypothetical protein n=1 Tax=Carnobacterium maltaromaticum TaxID=2751 RepID=UPI0039B027D6
MGELKSNLENLSKEQLIAVYEESKRVCEGLETTLKVYQRHLEQVVKYHSVESYCETVQRNREKGAASTAPKNN